MNHIIDGRGPRVNLQFAKDLSGDIQVSIMAERL